jgi:hypothetical protein
VQIGSDIAITHATPLRSGATAGGTDGTSGSPSRIVPGAEVRVEVLGPLGDGQSLVRIRGGLFAMELPEGVPPGSELRMTCTTLEPRPTFTLSLAQNVPSAVVISDAGRLLGKVMREIVEGPEETVPLPRPTLLAGASSADAAGLAESLRRALAGSGLFYEAHLAEWAAGLRTLEEILREPQGSCSQRLGGQPLPEGTVADPRTVPLLRDQLAALHNGMVGWRGEAWPGQGMDWLVEEREADGGGAERQWGSELTLDLPRLGKVRASIRLQGGDVRLRFRAGEETASLLQRQSSALADRFAAAGLGLADLAVSRDEAE